MKPVCLTSHPFEWQFWFSGESNMIHSPILYRLGRERLMEEQDDEESEDDAEDLDSEVTAYYESVERHYENYLDRKVKTYD